MSSTPDTHTSGPGGSEEALANRYILYLLGGQTFGSPLASVREVVQLGPVKPVPRMAQDFLGITNLRGQILGVIDLALRLGLQRDGAAKPLAFLIETGDTAVAAVIDDLVCVCSLSETEVERRPGLSRECEGMLGVARTSQGLVPLIDLAEILGGVTAPDLKEQITCS